MLNLLLSGQFDIYNILAVLISSLIVIFFTIPLHEWAHAFVASKLGDPTPGYLGRLNFNPFAHIDYFGALMIILIGVGWAKPVQINSRYFKNVKRDIALTAAAGPIMNILVAFISLFIYFALTLFSDNFVVSIIATIVFNYITINISLAVFNLIPIPPLDGSKILFALLPANIYIKVMQYERYFYFILMIILFSGAGSGVISNISSSILILLSKIAVIPFRIFLG